MNNKENNLEYLKKLVKDLGFGFKLNDVLAGGLRRKIDKFQIALTDSHPQPKISEKGKQLLDHTRFELSFNKASNGDTFYLNSIKAILHKTGETLPRIQAFDLTRDHRMTKLQMTKLLYGHSFAKEIYPRLKEKEKQEQGDIQRVKVWFKLDLNLTNSFGQHPLRSFYPEFNYNMEKAINKYPFVDFDQPEKLKEAVKLAENGNLVNTRMTLEGKTVPVTFGANPLNDLDIYDKEGQLISRERIFPDEKKENDLNIPKPEPTDQSVSEENNLAQEQPWEQEQDNDRGQSMTR